ncbi:MAG: sugar transferase [Bacteroidota bacterium]
MFIRLLALMLLVLLAPLYLIIGIAVWWHLGWPVLFVQGRSGAAGVRFRLWKFRSMQARVSPKVLSDDTSDDRERTPPFGHWLRRTGLDELPQLWNVAVGDMAFVGPRPLLPRYDPYYSVRERMRFRVRPGLTGLAQVSGRRALGWNDRLELDAQYVERKSVMLDLWVLWRTCLWAIQTHPPAPPMSDLDQERSSLAS